MPKKYEAIRDKLERQGMPAKKAKTKAAKFYNAQRKPGQKPVTRKKSAAKRSRKRIVPRNKVNSARQ